MAELAKELEKTNGDFAALFVSNDMAAEGMHGTIRGSDWPDYWWYSVLVMEKSLGRRICGARTEAGEMCTDSPTSTSGRCNKHRGFIFRMHSPDGTYDIKTAVSLLMNRVVLSFIKKCEPKKCNSAHLCAAKAEGELCGAELDLFHQMAVAKISDTIRAGLPMTMTQIISIRRIVTNEIMMMRNDADVSKEGSSLYIQKQMVSKFGETTDENYILNPRIAANALLAKQNVDISKSAMLTLKSQIDAKVAGKIAEAASETVKIKAGRALNSVLKEIHTMPKNIPGVGELAELYGEIAGIQSEVMPDRPDNTIHDGDIVYDEDGNPMQSKAGQLIPVPGREEIEI